jgi:hypothetical protein
MERKRRTAQTLSTSAPVGSYIAKIERDEYDAAVARAALTIKESLAIMTPDFVSTPSAEPSPSETERLSTTSGFGTTRRKRGYRVATVWVSRAARLFRRFAEMVRSMIAPQLMHFQA